MNVNLFSLASYDRVTLFGSLYCTSYVPMLTTFPPLALADSLHALKSTRIKYVLLKRRNRERHGISLPFVSFAVSPPLCSLGAPMKMPPTLLYKETVRNAPFILIFCLLSCVQYNIVRFSMFRK